MESQTGTHYTRTYTYQFIEAAPTIWPGNQPGYCRAIRVVPQTDPAERSAWP